MSVTQEQPEVVEVAPTMLVVEQQTRGEVDVQITTAKRYPRSVKTFIAQATELATLNEETAASCFYAIPRDGKTVEGPSARLAELCASAWGHMRIQARVVSEDDRFVTARGEAWDVQNNVAIGYEVRRRITGKNAKKFSDDMVVVTSNAAASIALRNAVFKIIPSAFWRPIYLKCRQVAVGKAETLANRRATMLAWFQQAGVADPARVFAVLGPNVKGIEDVTLEHMATLHGLATAIKDGDTSVDEAFPALTSNVVPMPSRRSEQNGTGTGADGAAASTSVSKTENDGSSPSQPATLPAGADRVQECVKRPFSSDTTRFWFDVLTARGKRCFTQDAAMGAKLVEWKDAAALVDLETEKDTRGQLKITTVQPFVAEPVA